MLAIHNVSNRVVLSFRDYTGKVGTFSVPRADIAVSTSRVIEAMTAMIDSGALSVRDLEGGKTIKGAKLVQTERRVIM